MAGKGKGTNIDDYLKDARLIEIKREDVDISFDPLVMDEVKLFGDYITEGMEHKSKININGLIERIINDHLGLKGDFQTWKKRLTKENKEKDKKDNSAFDNVEKLDADGGVKPVTSSSTNGSSK